MYIQNATYKAVPTAGLTFPIAEGTVLTVGDVTGIVPENISLAAPTGLIYLAVGGTIDLMSEANAGVSFTDAEMNSLGGDFNFVPKAESSGLPSFTSADKGKVLTIGEGEDITTFIVPEQTLTASDFHLTGQYGDDCEYRANLTSSFPTTGFRRGFEAVFDVVGIESRNAEFVQSPNPGSDILGWFSYGDDVYSLLEIDVYTDHYELYIGTNPAMPSDFSITLSLSTSTPKVEPKWEAAGLPDYSNAAEGAALKIVNGVPTWTTTTNSLT